MRLGMPLRPAFYLSPVKQVACLVACCMQIGKIDSEETENRLH